MERVQLLIKFIDLMNACTPAHMSDYRIIALGEIAKLLGLPHPSSIKKSLILDERAPISIGLDKSLDLIFQVPEGKRSAIEYDTYTDTYKIHLNNGFHMRWCGEAMIGFMKQIEIAKKTALVEGNVKICQICGEEFVIDESNKNECYCEAHRVRPSPTAGP